MSVYMSVRLSVCLAGCKDAVMAPVLKKLFETPYFRITVVPDAETVELCGALKVHYTIILYIYALTLSHKICHKKSKNNLL